MNKCAFDLGKKCYALKAKECPGCGFRKSEEELVAGKERASRRVATLPAEHQLNIKQKYYGCRGTR